MTHPSRTRVPADLPSRATEGLGRRRFIGKALWSAAAVAAWPASCRHRPPREARRGGGAAFNTANLVARYTGYRYELAHWGEQHRMTVALTDETAWRSICQDISATGFRAVEIWEAHASPEALDRSRARAWKSILSDHGLTPIAYAGRLGPQTLQICQWLEVPHLNGSLGGLNPDTATSLCSAHGVRFNLENHPEKAAAEILAPIGGGNQWLGVCIDTGWLGTQGASAPEIIRACGSLVRHTHIKDVKAAGAHESCELGQGVVDLEGVFKALREIDYAGWYSWEDEPEDRNPLDSAVRNRTWLETRIA